MVILSKIVKKRTRMHPVFPRSLFPEMFLWVKISKCTNCNKDHKTNSNTCKIRKDYLIDLKKNKDPFLFNIKSPENTFSDIETKNLWFKRISTNDNEQ